MAKIAKITRALELLSRAQREIIKRRIEAIKKNDMSADENLRNQMLMLEGFRSDIDNIADRIVEYISTGKFGFRISKFKEGKFGRIGRRREGRVKPLPPVGTDISGKYKGREFFGVVTEEGIKIEGVDGVFTSMSAAAQAVTGKKTINGWTFWKIGR